MNHPFQVFLWLLVQSFAPRHNAQIRFLKAQLAILRKRVPTERIVPTPAEKAELLRLGAELGHAVRPVLEVVQLATYRRWVSQARQGRETRPSGRPPVTPELRNLVLRIGRENTLWGYRRIVGELKKLGCFISHNSVKRILATEGIYPTPDKRSLRRPPMPRNQFVASHMDSLVARDFFTKTVHTWRGRRDAFCLVFLHLATRRVFCSPATFHPKETWVMQQARNAAMWMQDEGIQARWVLMDRDTKFGLHFLHFWKSTGIEAKRLPAHSPDCNAFCEAFVGRLKAESLNHFTVFSLRQMDYIVGQWLEHYLTERPSRAKGIGNRVLDPTFRPQRHGTVHCRQRLGGLLKSCYRVAA